MRQSAAEIQQTALTRAVTGESMANYAAIFEGFAAKGIPADQIEPRTNVFSFNAWKALGRYVRKGEHGVKICTFVPCTKIDKRTGEEGTYTRPWFVTVFHISQTEAIGGQQ